MKILYLTTSLSFAGAEQIILDLASSEFESTIVGLLPGDGELIQRSKKYDIDCVCLNMKSQFDWRPVKKLRALVNEEKIDLVHTHLVHANTLGRWTLRNSPTPVISSIHIIEKRFRPNHTFMERLTAKWAQGIVAVSPQVYTHAINQLHLPLEKLHSIPNGINTNRFQPTSEVRDIDLLFIGRLDHQKGLDQLLPQLKNESLDKKFHIVIAGNGQQEKQLKDLSHKYDLKITWLPQTREPEKLLARSKVVIMPSRWEGFGLVAAEALASGCVVIHSGVDSLPQLCGPHGIKLPSSVQEWSHIISQTIDNFRENPNRRQWIEKNYSKKHMIAAHKKLYEETLCVASPG